MSEIQTAAQIIDAKGGPGAFASAIGKKAGAVRMMKHRNIFPRVVWPEIIAAYPEITLDHLKNIESASYGPGSEAAA